MKILAICVAEPTTVQFAGKEVTTSIFKSPVDGPIDVDSDGLAGDRQADLTVHGGPNKAVYAYPSEHYDYWQRALDRPHLDAAQFGENLTVAGAPDDIVVVGSRYRFGDVIARVTQPRIPCHKLGARLNDERFPNRFWEAGRLGYYFAVEHPGSIETGMLGRQLDEPDHGITVSDLHRIVVSKDAKGALRAIANLSDLDGGWLRRLRQVLATD